MMQCAILATVRQFFKCLRIGFYTICIITCITDYLAKCFRCNFFAIVFNSNHSCIKVELCEFYTMLMQ